jgi:2-methylcitrate dehydratase PrpD
MDREEAIVSSEIVRFVLETQYSDFPTEVHHVATRCLIDGMGVILAGAKEPCVCIVRDFVLSLDGKKEATLLWKGKEKVPAHLAALVNGTAGHSMDWDDTALSNTPDREVLLHPTLPPLVAGLAIGEKLKVSGREFLTAFLVGFEVECKIAQAIYPDHWARGFHTSNTCGIFGATATVAKLLGLSGKEIRNSLGIAASMAAGVTVNLGTMAKPLHVGRAGESGIVAAQLAARGFEAHPDALEGHRGFFHAFGGGFDPAQICGRIGQPFSILNPGVSIKLYPCGVVGHPAMDAMKEIVLQYDIQPDQVDHVKVITGSNVLGPRGPLCYIKAQNALEAKFCVPFQMACMVIRRKAGIMEFNDEFVQTPQVQDMMDMVETIIDPKVDARGRDNIISLVEVRLNDGRILRGKSPEHYRGGPHNPLSYEEIAEKFNECVHEMMNLDQARNLMQAIESIEKLDGMHLLVERIP